MMPVAVPRVVLAITLLTDILKRRPNVSFPSNTLSRNTGTVTELLFVPAENVVDSRVASKSTFSIQSTIVSVV